MIQNRTIHEVSTKSNSSQSSSQGEQDYFENQEFLNSKVHFEIEYTGFFECKIKCFYSVKPKKKKFVTLDEKKKFIQDYKKKIKTELCKTFMLKGSCRYGNKVILKLFFILNLLKFYNFQCSFAHGTQELKEKSHLNSNFKTRPCRQYFLNGMCPYGYRCQYLHRELKYVDEFREFLISSYKVNGLSVKEYENFQTEREKLTKMEEEFKSFANQSQDVKLFFEKFHPEKT